MSWLVSSVLFSSVSSNPFSNYLLLLQIKVSLLILLTARSSLSYFPSWIKSRSNEPTKVFHYPGHYLTTSLHTPPPHTTSILNYIKPNYRSVSLPHYPTTSVLNYISRKLHKLLKCFTTLLTHHSPIVDPFPGYGMIKYYSQVEEGQMVNWAAFIFLKLELKQPGVSWLEKNNSVDLIQWQTSNSPWISFGGNKCRPRRVDCKSATS